MASRIRFHGSVIIAPQRARQLVARMERREIRGPADADIAFPDCAIGRRVAPTRWLHPGYELPLERWGQPRGSAIGPFHALRPGGSTTTIAPCLTRSKRSMTSSLVMRMQPDEMAWPIYSGWLVP